MSHFARADEEEGEAATSAQIREMEALIQMLRERNLLPPHVHMSNSAGLLNYPHAPGNLVRLGLALYGSSPQFSESVALKSAMTWAARVLQVKEVDAGRPVGYGGTYERSSPGRIAMVATGYGDGYPRILSNRADALVGGIRVPVAGRVSMDMLALDVTKIENIAPGDQVVLLGEGGRWSRQLRGDGRQGRGRYPMRSCAGWASACRESICGMAGPPMFANCSKQFFS